FIIDHSDPLWTYYLPVRWLLVPHGLTGAICLCLGATQFSTRLRQRHAQVHRVLGRCYVIGVAISAPLGIYITMLRNELVLRPSASASRPPSRAPRNMPSGTLDSTSPRCC